MTTAISIRPTYRQRYARNRGDAAHPGLWDGMVGHFAPRLGPTGGTLFDNSPLRNHGVLTNMENADDWSPASDGWNLNFGGTDEYVTSPSITAYDLTTAMSVCADFVITGNPVTTNYGIVYRGSNAAFGVAGNRWYFYSEANAAGGLLFLGSKVGASSFTTTNPSGFAAQASTRYRVAATFDNNRSTKWRFYINGLEYAQATPTDNGAFASAANPLRIGNLGSGGSEGSFLVGSIYELAIYNRAIPDDMGLRWSMGASPVDMKPKLVPVYIPTSGTAVNRTATDSLTTSESVTRTGVFGRTTTGAPTFADVVTRSQTLFRTAAEGFSTSESATRVVGQNRTTTDAPTFSDTVTRSQVLGRTATDAPTLSDTATRTGTFGRSTTDAPTVADSASRTAAVSRSVADAPTFSDSASRTVAEVRSTTDAPTFADTVTRSQVLGRTTTDAPTVADTATRVGGFSRSTTDVPTVSESVTRTVGLGRTTTDAPTFADVATRVSDVTRSASDSESTSDTASRVIGAVRSSTDAPQTSDTASRVFVGSRTTTESFALSDAAVAQIGAIFRTASESVTIGDSAARSFVGFRTATDSPQTSDSVARTISILRTATDAPTVSDSATRLAILLRLAVDTLVLSDVATATTGGHEGIITYGTWRVPPNATGNWVFLDSSTGEWRTNEATGRWRMN